MARSEYLDYLLQDVFGHIAGVTARRMFSGYGLYKRGVIFGLVIDDTLYFKTDSSNISTYKNEGSKPFSFERKNKVVETSYWEVPAHVLENKTLLTQWLDKSYSISRNSKSKK